MTIIKSISELVDSLQIERVCPPYITGANNFAKVESHRKTVDDRIRDYQNQLES